MGQEVIVGAVFVIKAEDLAALNYLNPDHPRPLLVEWINRGTNQKMRRTTIDQLLRTLWEDCPSPSIERLHQSAGLRLAFADGAARDAFATAFASARAQMETRREFVIATVFENLEAARHAVSELMAAGVPEAAISLLCRAGQFPGANNDDWQGHSKMSVAAAVAGGGIAGALLGLGMMIVVPGLGAVAAAGAIAELALPSIASVSAIFGATGGAMAKMLTDHDVDGREANYYERQIRRGRVFVSVDTRLAKGKAETARQVLLAAGGHTARAA